MSFIYEGMLSYEVLMKAKKAMTLEERHEMDEKIEEYYLNLAGMRMYSGNSAPHQGIDTRHTLEVGYLMNYCKNIKHTKLGGSLK